jgi:alkyldihydroxyacetonephosphate synthase
MLLPTLLVLTVIAVLVTAVLVARSRRGDEVRAWDPAPGERHDHLWGYRDTAFEFCGPKTVRLTGGRYPLAGSPLPGFVPFVEQVLGIELAADELPDRGPLPPLPPARTNRPFVTALGQTLSPGHWTDDDSERLLHSHGQLSVDEVYRILEGGLPERLVDLVVYPGDSGEVADLVRLAAAHDVVLIPYGGGTNVSGALLCPPDETRMIVSVDMSHMDRVLEIDGANRLATVEAGITGRALEARLEEAGYTCGHIPDSIEFSTLGGWIATHASGMKKNRYGNIEDVVREAVLVTPAGEVTSTPATPRNSTGIQPRNLLFGHEGALGIITRAIIQVYPRPEQCRYASLVFRDFAAGLGFLRAVQNEDIRPASIRLANNTEFRLGRALGRKTTGLHALVSRLKTFYVLRVRRFDPERMVICTLLMEGTARQVQQQWRSLSRLGRAAGGLSAGADGGRRGYQATFAIAYIRDFLNRFRILGETFETSAPWSRVEAITTAVEKTLREECAARGVTGRPYLSWRVSQSYPAGVCIYFTMGFPGRGLTDAIATYHAVEHRLREVILEQGGSLSHHHGVGKIRRDFISGVHSPAAIDALRAVKSALDPSDVFACRNHVFGLQTHASATTGGEASARRDTGT